MQRYAACGILHLRRHHTFATHDSATYMVYHTSEFFYRGCFILGKILPEILQHPLSSHIMIDQNFHHLEMYLEMLICEKNVASNTLASYRSDLTFFLKSIPVPALKVEACHISAFLQTQASSKPSTLARKISALRQFYKFLMSEDLIKYNPTKLLEGPKQEKRLPKYLSQEEIDRLFDVLSGEDIEVVRLRALLEILYATGLRVSELVSLSLSSFAVETATPFLIIDGKGGRERIVPLNQSAMDAVGNYLLVRPQYVMKIQNRLILKKAELYLFPSNGKEGHLTRQRVGQLLKQLAMDAAIDPKRISPHVIRHAFATHLLQNGADLLAIQKFLGHTDLTTTEIYTHVLPNHLTNLVTSYHPLSKKKSMIEF